MKTLLKILATLVGLLIIAVVALILFAYSPLPTVDEIEELYTLHREGYAARTAEIRAKLEKGEAPGNRVDETLGYFAYETRSAPFSVTYLTHSSGIGVGAYGTGLAYFDAPPEKIYGSVESMKQDMAAVEGFRGYLRIAEDWYFVLWEAD